MKTLFKFSLVVFLLVIAAMVVLPFVIDINKYKGRIESLVERQIRGEIEIGQIRFSTFPWLGLSVKGISIKNRKAPESPFDGGEVLNLKEAGLKVRVKSLIKGRIVAGLIFQGPKIHLIKSKEGTTNLDDLLPPKTAPSPSLSAILTGLATNKWVQRVLVEEIKLSEGELHNDSLLLPFDVTLSSIQLEDPSKPIRLELTTATNKVPIGLKTGIRLDPKEEVVRLEDGTIEIGKGKIPFAATAKKFLGENPEIDAKISSTGLDLPSLFALNPAAAKGMKGIKIDGNPAFEVTAQGTPKNLAITASLNLTQVGLVQGEPVALVKGSGVPFKIELASSYREGNVTIQKLTVDLAGSTLFASGVVGTTVDLSIRSEKILVEELKKILLPLKSIDAPVSNVVFDLKASGPANALTIDLNQASLSAFDGTLTAKGSVRMKSGGGASSEVTLDAKDLEVSKLTNVASGKGNLHLAVTGSGLDFDALSKTLEGKGQLKLVNGRLKTMNLLTSVFSPKIAELLRGGVTGRMEEVALPGLHEEGTSYQSITMPFRLEKGRLIVSEMVLEQSGYEGRLQGSIGIDMTADLTGRMLFSKETSARLIPNPKMLPYVTNEERRLVIPFRITGNLKEPTVTPDGEYVKTMVANAAKRVVVEEGTKVIQEKVVPELQKEAGKILKGLFR